MRKKLSVYRLFLLLVLSFNSFEAFSTTDSTIFAEDSIRYFLDNGIIRVGFDKRMGGVVSYFERKTNGINLINNHDAGRQAGFETRIYPDMPATWRPFPNAKYLSEVYLNAGGASREWNGLPQGSFYNQNFKNLSHLGGIPEKINFDAKTGVLYVKSKLWEWGFVNQTSLNYEKIDAGAYNEYWISLTGFAANFTVKQVRNIPYFVSNTNTGVSLHLFVNINYPFAVKWQTYNASNPFNNEGILSRTNFERNTPDNDSFWSKSTENWVAMTNQNDFGMGIYTRDNRFSFLYAERQVNVACTEPVLNCPDEQRYSFGTFSFSTYGFPCGEPCTTHNSSTTLNFSLIAGNVSEIRAFAYQKQTNPCDNIIALSSKNDDIDMNSIVKSKILIDANNQISSAATIYQTGKTILLNPGFKVSNGAVFSTQISANPCE
ncbi:hypothetical protein EMA8858_04133 [Emticicia aquatica]|uniref:Uncharacterized protein n=1 Tax=Emticicia aquatica TaxID=1681835 RepID=A0ABN8F412_9BACT|nr:3-coathanger stack domain-containing protein [Emticicia aquatica]CAH0997998.1 hypothetical protein EMA8858_04133 [Emticicia aquatica]